MHLIGNDDIGIEGILLVRGAGQGVDTDKTILANVAGYGVLHVVVNDSQSLDRVIVHRQVLSTEVISQEIKPLQSLF